MSATPNTTPVPPPCVTCDHAKADHSHEGCDALVVRDQVIAWGLGRATFTSVCPCEAWLDPAAICIDCDGSGKLHAPGRDWDGSDCPTCRGRGVDL